VKDSGPTVGSNLVSKDLISSLGVNLNSGPSIDDSKPIGSIILNDIMKESPLATARDFSGFIYKRYIRDLEKTINDGIKKYKGNFFIEMNLTKDKLLYKTYKLLPVLRKTCPIPFYDRDVYMYDHKVCKLKLLWSIPPRKIFNNPQLLPLEKGSNEILESMKKFNNGTYFKIYEKLINGEIV